MNNKQNVFLILAILILPIVLYSVFKSPDDTGGITIAAGQPTVLKFSSPLCMECKELDKVIKVVQPKYENKINFVKINVNSSDASVQSQVRKYHVSVVPTTVFINKKGQVVKKMEGSMPQKELDSILEELTNG